MRSFRAFIIILSVATLSCGAASAQKVSWKTVRMDSTRTGCVSPGADNVRESLGEVRGGVYYAPNGKIYRKGSVVKVADAIIKAQPAVASVKEVIGYSERGMKRTRGQHVLSNWYVDFMMQAVEGLTGRKVDVAITNFGGIREDMPQGKVTLDNIMSMFPFKNTLCHVSIKGSDLLAIYQQMAARSVQAVGGVKLTIEDRKVKECLVGGEPIQPDKVYGLATINFLLNGGDGLDLSKNAIEIKDSGTYVMDAVIPYIRELTAQGKTLDYELDDRVTYINDRRKQ